MSSRRYRVDQELEIYNFRVVPDLQISKTVDFFNDLHVFFTFNFIFLKRHLFKSATGETTRQGPPVKLAAARGPNTSPLRKFKNDGGAPTGQQGALRRSESHDMIVFLNCLRFPLWVKLLRVALPWCQSYPTRPIFHPSFS